MIVLFFGSRDWTDRDCIYNDVRTLAPDDVVLQGGARGADSIAGEAARHFGLHVAEMPALWATFGRAAGPRRNAAMLLLRPDRAFGYDLGGSGTADMARRLDAAGVPYVMRGPDGEVAS